MVYFADRIWVTGQKFSERPFSLANQQLTVHGRPLVFACCHIGGGERLGEHIWPMIDFSLSFPLFPRGMPVLEGDVPHVDGCTVSKCYLFPGCQA